VTKTGFGAGASELAQGGIAAASGSGDEPALHAADTVRVGAGLVDEAVARLVASKGPGRIDWLKELGAEFDQTEVGSLHLGREAGHSRNRIVHADGDATGREVMRALRRAVRLSPDIEVREHTQVIDLARAGGRVVGAVTLDRDESMAVVLAPAVILATGGIGRVFARTTNPQEATGDGLAVAARAGAALQDLEFVQFHPTALSGPADPLPLLTEALRGAGATLIDSSGHRFMAAVHPDAELAPRDVVARGVWHRLIEDGAAFVDATSIGADFPTRFPTVFAAAADVGLDPRTEPLPVTPAAHYHMGGVATDMSGRTSLPGLFACGEVAATGLHGANRLASNSLLEGLVFAERVALAVQDAETPLRRERPEIPALISQRTPHVEAGVEELRRVMWSNVGVVRDGRDLAAALERLDALQTGLESSLRGRNLLTVARLVTTQALHRKESRGSHFRSDHPVSAQPRHAVVTPKPVAVVPVGRTVAIHEDVA
jgi:L-aspartate oxidase